MDMLLFFIGIIGFLVCIVLTVVSVIKKNGKVKKFGIGILVSIVLMIVGLAMAPSSTSTTSNKSNVEVRKLTGDELVQMYSNPDNFKGCEVDLYAKIFAEVEKDEDGTYIQAWGDPENREKNILIQIADPNLDVKNDDIIHVVGIVKKSFTGKNAFGGEITAPVINASLVEKATYIEAFSPTLKTLEVNKEINQKGFVIKLSKIEFAEKETRVYFSITNNSKENISFWKHNSKAVQASKQFELTDNYDAGYEQMQTDILPGVVEEGMLLFPVLNQDEDFKIILEGFSDNYEIDIKPFTYEIAVN